VSAGGLHALTRILQPLPANFPLPIMIVQHLPATAGESLPECLNRCCQVVVKQAENRESPRPGFVYLAPPDYHLLVEMDHTLSLTVDERVHYARPAIDELFETAAEAYASALIGVVLTGASADGSRGLQKIKELGGYTVVQDPATAQSPVMPQAALRATTVDRVAPLEEIGDVLMGLAKVPAPGPFRHRKNPASAGRRRAGRGQKEIGFSE
jgi:two-component system chemotaxis response regulator CheB